MRVFYRVSDKGRPKPKLEKATKIACLENALNEFGKENFYVFADNCNNDTLDYLKNSKIPFEETSLGNCGSFLYMCNYIFEHCSESEYVYLLEDDYFHLNGSRQKLEQGLEIADYVTLYDHPDKYAIFNPKEKGEGVKNDGVPANPLNWKNLQQTRLFLTKSSHWRETNSTTMTFATKVKTLKEDFSIWEKCAKGGPVPKDFAAYLALTQNSLRSFFCLVHAKKKREALTVLKNFLLHKKTRLLISAVPASATHAEIAFLAPIINWNDV